MCHKQIHVMKQISIKCNRIEHWVHLRCAGIRQEQYTDSWTCHLHRKSRLTPHTDITLSHPSRLWSKPPTHSPPTPPTPPQPNHRQIQQSPFPTGLVSPDPILSPTNPLSTHSAPTQAHTLVYTLHLHLSPHSSQAPHLY